MNAFIGQFPTIIVLILFVAALYFLSKATDVLIDSAVTLSLKLGISQMVVGATVLSLGTTLPEVSSSIIATLNGNMTFALGNAIGSVITNTTLVLGLGAIAGMVPVKRESKAKLSIFIGVAVLFIAGTLPRAAFFEYGYLPQWMGGVLLALLPLYVWFLLTKESEGTMEEVELEEDQDKVQRGKPTWQHFLILVASSAVVSFSAALLVTTAEISAARFGVPDTVIASTIVAFGTSVPEVSTTLVATRYGHGDLAIGNVLGANVMNILLVMGGSISFMGEGLFVPGAYYRVQFPVVLLLLILFSYFVFNTRKQTIAKKEGFLLLGIYAAYFIVNFIFV